MTNDDRLDALRKALRAKARSDAGEVTLGAGDLRLLLDELGRLQQSNDRLRRQNRRVRLRLQRLPGGAAPDAAADASGEDGAAGDDAP